MESKPVSNFRESAPSEGTDSKDTETASSKKKKGLRHVPLSAPEVEKPKAAQPDSEAPKPDLFECLKKAEAEPDHAESAEVNELAVLDQEEMQHINQQIAAEHLETIETESPEAVEQLAAGEFLEKVQEGVDPDDAFAEVAAEIGMSEDEIQEQLAEEVPPLPEDAPEVSHEEEPDDPDATTMGAGGGSTGGTVPPAGPGGPPGPVGGGGGGAGPAGPGRPVGGAAPINPNAAPQPVALNPNQQPRPNIVTVENRRAQAGQLLLVGLVGYLIGRRRGRIRTEKKLLPVQKKLETQVRSLEQNITIKEQQLNRAQAQIQERQPVKPVEAPRRSAERPMPTEARMQPGRAESRLSVEKPIRAERLGHMVMAAEAPEASRKVIIERPNNIRQAFRAEEVKTMRRNELLELSEKIVIEGANLRRIYESRLIGEKQLRHLVSEYLQGHDIRRALRQEMVEHEIDFERDPILRDRVRSHLATGDGNGGLGDLLASVGIVENETDTQLERRIQKEAARREAAEARSRKQRTITDVAMVTAVTVLAIVVAILALRG